MESTTETPGLPEKPVDQTTENINSTDEVNVETKEIPSLQNEMNENTEAENIPAAEVPHQEETHEKTVVAENIPATEVPHEEETHLNEIAAHHEEVEAEPLEQFGTMSKEQLLDRMKALSHEQDVNSVKNRINAAKDAFQLILNHERDAALAVFIEAGGIREEFDYKDSLEEPFFEAYKSFQKRRSEFVQGQEKIRTQNLKAKNDILQQMKNILQQEEDMSKAFNEFHELQAKWRAIGPVPSQNVNDLWMTYKLYSDRFYEFIKINRELQDLEMKKNLEMKMHLCEKAEEMLLEPSLNKALQEIQSLQHKWREIGAVPREKRTEIWVRFKAAVDKVYENKRGYMDSMKQQFETNLAAKRALIEKTEELVKGKYEKHSQWQDGLKQLLELQADWRKIGPAGKDHNDSIWAQFKNTCDQFFKNKDAFYKNKKQEYATNLQAKTELCIQAEALKESNDWKATANELIRLQQEWKKIGPAGEKNEKIWQRFKVACDEFFTRKTAHFADQDQQQGGNLEKKNQLIATVESFQFPEDANEALDQLKAFQRQFTEIGLVPMANKDDIQQRFRAAIQVHFDSLKSKPEYKQSFRPRHDNGERQERQPRNDRHERNYQGGNVASENSEQRDLQNKVNKLNSEVQLWENNLGFFAKSKNANALKEEYEQKIQQAKDEISALKNKLKELRSA